MRKLVVHKRDNTADLYIADLHAKQQNAWNIEAEIRESKTGALNLRLAYAQDETKKIFTAVRLDMTDVTDVIEAILSSKIEIRRIKKYGVEFNVPWLTKERKLTYAEQLILNLMRYPDYYKKSIDVNYSDLGIHKIYSITIEGNDKYFKATLDTLRGNEVLMIMIKSDKIAAVLFFQKPEAKDWVKLLTHDFYHELTQKLAEAEEITITPQKAKLTLMLNSDLAQLAGFVDSRATIDALIIPRSSTVRNPKQAVARTVEATNKIIYEVTGNRFESLYTIVRTSDGLVAFKYAEKVKCGTFIAQNVRILENPDILLNKFS